MSKHRKPRPDRNHWLTPFEADLMALADATHEPARGEQPDSEMRPAFVHPAIRHELRDEHLAEILTRWAAEA